MSKSKAVLLAAYGILSATATQGQGMYELTNPYADLPPLRYTGGDTRKDYKKEQLTNKQQKSRAAAKRAKKARKRNR